MAVKVSLNGTEKLLNPTTEWNSLENKTETPKLEIDKNFYVAGFNITE
jgi:hypothetical protein